MKLYYTKGTCSFGPHIAMRELGIEPEMIPVNLMEKKLPGGGDFKGHNPKGFSRLSSFHRVKSGQKSSPIQIQV